MKSKLIACFLLVSSFLSAQSVNDYVAIIVPVKFDFQNTENEYRLSTITKYKLEKLGFKAVYSNSDYSAEYPNRCSLLNLDLVKLSGFLNTKLQVTLKDCFGKLIYTSESGKSQEKDFEDAYKEALTLAFESVKRLEYKYNGKNGTAQAAALIAEPKQEVVAPIENKIVPVSAPAEDVNLNANVLYAQPTTTGYQLIDKTPKVVMKLIKTDNPNSFKAFKGDEEGVLNLRDNKWIFDTFQKDRFSEVLIIKF